MDLYSDGIDGFLLSVICLWGASQVPHGVNESIRLKTIGNGQNVKDKNKNGWILMNLKECDKKIFML